MHDFILKRNGKFVRPAFPGECHAEDGFRDAYSCRDGAGNCIAAQPAVEGPKGVVFGSHLYVRDGDVFRFHSHGYSRGWSDYFRAVCGA